MVVANGKTDNVTITNCDFNYGLDYYRNTDSILAGWQPYHDNGAGWLNSKGVSGSATYNNGIAIWFSGDNWNIHDNTFNNYTIAAIEPVIGSQSCRDALIHDNVFTNASQSGRAINSYNPTASDYFNLKFYRNKIDGMRINAIQHSADCDSIFYYYNLITDCDETNPQVYGESGELAQLDGHLSYFWWNTVVDASKWGFNASYPETDIRNNIFINLGSHASIDYVKAFYLNSGSGVSCFNNTWYAQGKNTSSTLFYLGGNYTFLNFEAQLGSGADNELQASATNYLTALLEDATDYKPQDGYTGEASVSKTEFMRWKLGASFQDLFGNNVTESNGAWSTTIQRGYANEVIP
jgi:hypothetical protein